MSPQTTGVDLSSVFTEHVISLEKYCGKPIHIHRSAPTWEALKSFYSEPSLFFVDDITSVKRAKWLDDVEVFINGEMIRLCRDSNLAIKEPFSLPKSSTYDDEKPTVIYDEHKSAPLAVFHRNVCVSTIRMFGRSEVADYMRIALYVLVNSTKYMRVPRVGGAVDVDLVKTAIQRICKNTQKRAIDAIDIKITDLESALNDYGERIRQTAEILVSFEMQKTARLDDNGSASIDQAEKISALISAGLIESIKFEDERITVTTSPVTLKNISLGRYVVIIATTGRDRVHITAESRPVESYPHPHISSSGLPCWGNVYGDIEKLIAGGDIAGSINLILRFLNSYNASGAYRQIENFRADPYKCA